MTWAKLDDKIAENPKVLRVPPATRWLYVAALAYSRGHDTGGRLDHHVVDMLLRSQSVRKAAVRELVEAGLWEVDETPAGPNSYRIHDYQMYGPPAKSAQEVEEILSKRRENGRVGGKRSAEARRGLYGSAQPNSSAEANTEAPPKQKSFGVSFENPASAPKQNPEAPRSPVPTRPVPGSIPTPPNPPRPTAVGPEVSETEAGDAEDVDDVDREAWVVAVSRWLQDHGFESDLPNARLLCVTKSIPADVVIGALDEAQPHKPVRPLTYIQRDGGALDTPSLISRHLSAWNQRHSRWSDATGTVRPRPADQPNAIGAELAERLAARA